MSSPQIGPYFEPESPAAEERESPRHGFQGDRAPAEAPIGPTSLTIALSREAGSRGGTIARRVGKRLGWQVFHQDLLEYTAQEGNFRESILANLPPAVARWVEDRMEHLQRDLNLGQNPSVLEMVRLLLVLAAQGEVVVVGRGAGCILPPETTLNVRTVAPLNDRIAYMSQWSRLSLEEAAEQVRLRDARRADFIVTHFHRQPSDVHQYDLILNTSLLGEDLCVDLIVQAARAKLAARQSGERTTDEHR